MSLRSQSINYFLGNYDDSFYGYSNDEQIRKHSASGGMVTQFLIYLLEKKMIDGAVVSRLLVKQGTSEPQAFIATTIDELKESQTSIYIDFPWLNVLKEIEEFAGKLAMVALPCQLKAAAKLRNSDKIIKIGLFCGHTSKRDLIEQILKSKVVTEQIKSFRFRMGHWRGKSRITMNSGEDVYFPYFDFGMFQNLFFHMPQRCLYCRDHTAETSDISFGDLWLKEFKKHRVKHSCIISRKQYITDILDEMAKNRIITIGKLSADKVISSQKRPLIYHKFTTSALKKIMRADPGGYRFNWNDYIAALLILFNMNMSQKMFSRIFYILPKRLVFLYMVFVRIFLSF